MLKKSRYLTFLASIVFLASLQASEPPGLGDQALPFEVEQWLQVPEGQEVTLESLRGQAVVLEFWATWCGPCVGAIPHMNELAEEFSDRPLKFLSVTGEDRETVESFLEFHTMKGWLGLDEEPRVQKGYGISAIPTTVLIDSEGRVAGLVHPENLNSGLLEKLLAGGDLGVGDIREKRRESDEKFSLAESDLGDPVYEIRIRPILASDMPGTMVSRSNDTMIFKGFSAQRLITSLNRFGPIRTLIEAELPEGIFLVTAKLPQHSDLRAEVLRAALGAFGVQQTIEEREVEVLRAVMTGELGPQLKRSENGAHSGSSSRNQMTFTGSTIASFLASLEYRLKIPLLDETGFSDDDTFNLHLEVPSWEREDVIKAAMEQLGLHFIPDRRRVELAIIIPKHKDE